MWVFIFTVHSLSNKNKTPPILLFFPKIITATISHTSLYRNPYFRIPQFNYLVEISMSLSSNGNEQISNHPYPFSFIKSTSSLSDILADWSLPSSSDSAKLRLVLCNWIIFSSMVFSATSRYMVTGRF